VRARLPDLIGGAVFLGAAAVLFAQTRGTGPVRDEIARDPFWYPRVLLVLVAVAAIALVVRALLRRRDRETASAEDPVWRRLAVAVAVVAAYFAAFEPAGYLVASLVAFPVFAFALGYRRVLVSAFVSLFFVVSVWFLFADVFVVRPPGLGIDDLLRTF